MPIFKQELAIDLGTANTFIFKDNKIVLDEPSIIAVEAKTGKLMAIGTCLALKNTGNYPFLMR